MKLQFKYPAEKMSFILAFYFSFLLSYIQADAQTIVINNNTTTCNIKTEQGENIQIEHEGTIILSNDDKSITDISEGGFFKVKKTTFGNKREIFIRKRGGKLQYEYSEGGREKDFEPDGKAWLADILPDLVRSTGIGAESRIERFYSKSGTKGVLNEIGNLKNDHVKAEYYKLLLKKDIKESEIPSVITNISENLKSDFYTYEVYKVNSTKLLANKNNLTNFFTAIGSIKSDFYKAELVKIAFDKDIPKGSSENALKLIRTINSDFYQYEVLNKLAGNTLSHEEYIYLFELLIPEIRSAYYKSEALNAFLKKNELTPATINTALKTLESINSDHYAATSLSVLIDHQSLNDKSFEIIFAALQKVKSDFYKAESMKKVIKDQRYTGSFDKFLEASAHIKSNEYRSTVYDYAIKHSKLTDEQMVKLINDIKDISSDHYKTEILLRVCKSTESEKVKAAVRSTAKTINSTHYYGTVMKCIE